LNPYMSKGMVEIAEVNRRYKEHLRDKGLL